MGCGFFSWGGGGGEEELQVTTAETFSQTTRVPNSPLCLCLYYILRSGSFAAAMRKAIANGDPDPRYPGQTRALFGLRQPVDLVHTLKTVKGLLLLVPPRTPRSSGYDVYAHAVYVVICHISVICLVLGPSCYMYMSVICCYMLYVCDMLYVCFMSSTRGGS